MNNLSWGLLGIAFTFFSHYFFVTIVLGLSMIIPIYEIAGNIRKDQQYINFARKLTSYLIRVDLFAGVLATWLTVFLAAYWPSLLFTATDALFYPVSLAIAGIMIALVSMALYWYTWDKMSSRSHIAVGIFMMIGALLVPLGMSSIFATIDYPYGIQVTKVSGLTLFIPNGQNVFYNPIYWPLVFYTWFIALAVTSFIVTYYASRKVRSGDFNENTFKISRNITLLSSFLSLIFMFWLIYELKTNSQYIYNSMQSNLSLITSEALVVLILMLSIGMFSKSLIRGLSLIGGALSYFLMMFFEIEMNVTRYPYIIVLGNTGIPASYEINPLFNIPALLPELALLTFALTLATFLFTLYLAFVIFPVDKRNKTIEEY